MENDASVSHVSHEETASTVETATMKVERTTSRDAPATTGRTAWDALVDIGGMLGRYTPWIIMVAGVLYGAYKFIELTHSAQQDAQDAAQRARDAAQDEIKLAQTELRNTYAQIGVMHKQQLENLLSMLNVNKATTESTELQRSSLTKLQEEIRTKQEEARQAQKDVAQAQKDAAQAQSDVISAKQTLERASNTLEETRQQNIKIMQQNTKIMQQLQDKQRELDRKVSTIQQRAKYIKEQKDKLSKLAEDLVRSADSSVVALGRDILDKTSSSEAINSLTAYAKQPGKDTAEPLDELLGSSEEPLEVALQQGLEFTFWQKYSKKDGTKTAYIGVVRQTDVIDEGIVLLTVGEKKVVNVDVFPRGLSLAGRDPDDWNKPIAYNLYLRPTGEAGIDLFTPKTTQWKILETTDFDEKWPPKEIYGSEKPLDFMSFDDFKKEAEIYEAAKASKNEGFLNMVAMLENEKGFDANKIAEPFATKIPKEIRETFVQLLTDSVKRAEGKSVRIASASKLPREVYGPIAAAALKPGFKIEDVRSSQAATGSSTQGETYFILCHYGPVRASSQPQYARLTFTREGSDGKWMLLNFENPVVLPSARAE